MSICLLLGGFILREQDSLCCSQTTVIRLFEPLMGQINSMGLTLKAVHIFCQWWFEYLVVSQFNQLTPSTHSLQIYDENVPSFAVSTLMSSNQRALPQCRTLYILPCHVEPRKTLISVGHHLTWCAERKAGVDMM